LARAARIALIPAAAALVAAHEALHHLFQHERAGDLVMELDVEPVEQAADLDALARPFRQQAAVAEREPRVSSRYSAIGPAPGTASPFCSWKTGVVPAVLSSMNSRRRSQTRSSTSSASMPNSLSTRRMKRECGHSG
jgi:hypothetical protein